MRWQLCQDERLNDGFRPVKAGGQLAIGNP